MKEKKNEKGKKILCLDHDHSNRLVEFSSIHMNFPERTLAEECSLVM